METDELIKLYESGKSCREISELTNIPEGTIDARLRRYGVKFRTKRDYYLPIEKIQIEIVKDYTLNKISLEKIEKKYNIGTIILNSILKKHGVEKRKPKKTNEEDKKKIIKMYKNGLGTSQIAQEIGIHKSIVYRIVKNAGIVRTVSESMTGKVMKEEYKLKRSLTLKGRFMGKDRWNTSQLKEGYNQLTNELTYILGVVKGDAYLAPNGIRLEVIDLDFIHEFKRCLEKQFGLECKIHQFNKSKELKDWRTGKIYERNDTYRLDLNSVLASEFIKSINMSELIPKLNMSQKISFLRGLWDSEGSVSISGRTNKTQFTHNTLELCQLYQKLVLETCEFKPIILQRKKQGNYDVYFYRKEYIKTFYNTIKPTIRRKCAVFEQILNS